MEQVLASAVADIRKIPMRQLVKHRELLARATGRFVPGASAPSVPVARFNSSI